MIPITRRILSRHIYGFVLMSCAVSLLLATARAARAGVDGASPEATVVLASNGMLYGTTRFGGTYNDSGTIFRVSTDGSSYKVLYNFGNGTDAANPAASLIQGKDGALYGTTVFGGAYSEGTVFTINMNGTGYKVLHSFGSGSDGQSPLAGLIQATNGILYGTTEGGGTSFDGTIFQITTEGRYKTIHNFHGGADGAGSYAALIQGSDKALYGTTYQGGKNSDGILFKQIIQGTYTVLHNFGGSNDGANPDAQLLEASNGMIYGTTYDGGTHSYGAVFLVDTDGSGYQVIHNFGAGQDGKYPQAGLIEDSDGILHGTTYAGGGQNLGTLYTIGLTGDETVVYNCKVSTSPHNPVAPLIQPVSGGLIYGTTLSGGGKGNGVVFSVEPDGSGLVVLHAFNGGS